MARHRRALPALAAVGLLLAGCGGDAPPDSYALEPTRTCLRDAEVPVTSDGLDFVATTALGGAMRVRLSPTNFVVMAFGENEAEAQRIEQAYRDFAGRSIPINDVLERRKNLVLVWNAPPTGDEENAVASCLQGAG